MHTPSRAHEIFSVVYRHLPLYEVRAQWGKPPTQGLMAAWCLSLLACVGLGIASIVYQWSGLPLHFGGVDVYLTAYPPLTICAFWVLWFGFWWGAIPAYVSTLVLAVYSGMPLGWSVLFAFSDPLALAVFTVVYRAVPISYDLRSLNSIMLFALLAFVSGILGASGSFVWTHTNTIGMHDAFTNWQGWWLGGFVQLLLTVAPVLALVSPAVVRWRDRHFITVADGDHDQQRVLMAAGILVAGVLSFLLLSFVLARQSSLPNPGMSEVEALRHAARLANEAASAVYWVLAILLLSMSFLGYRFFVYWTSTLELALQEAEQASLAKSDFLARMSHEIRTPMNAIVGMTRLSLRTELTPRQVDYLEKIRASSDALLGIINDILDFSKVEAGKLQLEHIRFSLDEVLDSVSSMVLHRAEAKGVGLHIMVSPDVPGALQGDPLRLGQILTNLVSNAVKFTDQGEVRVGISLVLLEGGTVRLQFDVRDTGIGLNAEQINRLFDAFTQADESITRQYGGTGLGLAICKQLVEAMGGQLWVDSLPGKGSCFSFSLDLQVAEPLAAAEPRNPPLATPVEVTALQGAHVLLVEDNPINREIAEAYLHDAGVRVTVAENGQQGVELASAQVFDAVLMDVQMPVMDGLSAARRLREEARLAQLPIIAMTAHALSGDRERCIAAGMNDYLTKPLDHDLLCAMLARWMGRVPQALPSGLAEADNVLPLPVFPGIDLAVGLRRLNNRRERYFSILGNFRRNHAATAQGIVQAAQAGEHEEVHRIAHTLKSVADYMGASELTQLALALELASAEPEHDYSEALQAFVAALQALMQALDSVLPTATNPPIEETV
ncbi:ATP-binding protein [Chitinimonas viridis]|uniref:histidine kinase n=1 Tax=Chitinimonas viridis TaxID=664880 RepID=A0ABT8B7I3_9NEIS|nr:hybrid sensor histidine kinase/response regulator [Chitinimonas viridis]MDN3577586.1 ATP-binding protein [Chitinimonas viridis]